MASGIELTAHCLLNRIQVELDGQRHEIKWESAQFLAAPPGKNQLKVTLEGALMSGPSRSLEVQVDPGQITEVAYSLTVIALTNPGKLEVKGKRAAPVAAAAVCAKCSAAIPEGARFCPQCAAPVKG